MRKGGDMSDDADMVAEDLGDLHHFLRQREWREALIRYEQERRRRLRADLGARATSTPVGRAVAWTQCATRPASTPSSRSRRATTSCTPRPCGEALRLFKPSRDCVPKK
jgi:hypothetical protein